MRVISALLVVDDERGIDSSPRLDLASQAPCARHLVVSPRAASVNFDGRASTSEETSHCSCPLSTFSEISPELIVELKAAARQSPAARSIVILFLLGFRIP